MADRRFTELPNSQVLTGDEIVAVVIDPDGSARTIETTTQQIADLAAARGGTTSNTDIDDRIASWARAHNPSGTIPDNRIPDDIARDAELPTGLPNGGTAGQLVERTATGYQWRDAPRELPTGWAASQILQRNAANDGWEWVAVPTTLPAGWAASRFLRRNSDNDGWEWVPLVGLPSGGANGNYLERTATGYRWIAPRALPVANPAGSATATLNTLELSGTIYQVGAGALSSAEPPQTLTTGITSGVTVDSGSEQAIVLDDASLGSGRILSDIDTDDDTVECQPGSYMAIAQIDDVSNPGNSRSSPGLRVYNGSSDISDFLGRYFRGADSSSPIDGYHLLSVFHLASAADIQFRLSNKALFSGLTNVSYTATPVKVKIYPLGFKGDRGPAGPGVAQPFGTRGQLLAVNAAGDGTEWVDPPDTFDIHDKVTTSAAPHADDRFIFSDESAAGDPMAYATLSTIAGAIAHLIDGDNAGDIAITVSSNRLRGTIRPNAVVRARLAADQQIPALAGNGGKFLTVNQGGTAVVLADPPEGSVDVTFLAPSTANRAAATGTRGGFPRNMLFARARNAEMNAAATAAASGKSDGHIILAGIEAAGSFREMLVYVVVGGAAYSWNNWMGLAAQNAPAEAPFQGSRVTGLGSRPLDANALKGLRIETDGAEAEFSVLPLIQEPLEIVERTRPGPTMILYDRGSLSSTAVQTLAQYRAHQASATQHTTYRPLGRITSDVTEPAGDNYVLRQRFLLRTDEKWNRLDLKVPAVGVDDAIALFLLRSDRYGSITDHQLARAWRPYTTSSITQQEAISQSDALWGERDPDGHYYLMLEAYLIEKTGAERLDYTVGYRTAANVVVAPGVVNGLGEDDLETLGEHTDEILQVDLGLEAGRIDPAKALIGSNEVTFPRTDAISFPANARSTVAGVPVSVRLPRSPSVGDYVLIEGQWTGGSASIQDIELVLLDALDSVASEYTPTIQTREETWYAPIRITESTGADLKIAARARNTSAGLLVLNVRYDRAVFLDGSGANAARIIEIADRYLQPEIDALEERVSDGIDVGHIVHADIGPDEQPVTVVHTPAPGTQNWVVISDVRFPRAPNRGDWIMLDYEADFSASQGVTMALFRDGTIASSGRTNLASGMPTIAFEELTIAQHFDYQLRARVISPNAQPITLTIRGIILFEGSDAETRKIAEVAFRTLLPDMEQLRLRAHFRGEFSATATYGVGDTVTRSGTGWRANRDTGPGWTAAHWERETDFRDFPLPYDAAIDYPTGANALYQGDVWERTGDMSRGIAPGGAGWTRRLAGDDGVRDHYRGPWTSGTQYEVNDLVENHGMLYRCKVRPTQTTTDPALDPTRWEVISAYQGDWDGSANTYYRNQIVRNDARLWILNVTTKARGSAAPMADSDWVAFGLSLAQVDGRIAPWARAGNSDPIPASKLANAPSAGDGGGGEQNVQADWTETDNTADSFIRNKPGNATSSVDGFQSAVDKAKLDRIPGNADHTGTALAALPGRGARKHLAVTANGLGFEFVDPPTPGTGGITQAQARDLIARWARFGNQPWDGSWASGTQYYAGELVTWRGHVSRALIDHVSAAGNEPWNSATHWAEVLELLVYPGSQGQVLGGLTVSPGNPPRADEHHTLSLAGWVYWRGPYYANQAYGLHNLVTHAGGLWICTAAHEPSAAETPSDTASKWDRLGYLGNPGSVDLGLSVFPAVTTNNQWVAGSPVLAIPAWVNEIAIVDEVANSKGSVLQWQRMPDLPTVTAGDTTTAGAWVVDVLWGPGAQVTHSQGEWEIGKDSSGNLMLRQQLVSGDSTARRWRVWGRV